MGDIVLGPAARFLVQTCGRRVIFHILRKHEWQQALERGCYEPVSLRTEGFVHCSTREQTLVTASRYFRGQTDLMLLYIDPSRLRAELRLEHPSNPQDERAGELFPHVYGPINLDAVRRSEDFPYDSAGDFLWPAGTS